MNEAMKKQLERAAGVLPAVTWERTLTTIDPKIVEAYTCHLETTSELWSGVVCRGETGPPDGAVTDLKRGVIVRLTREQAQAAIEAARKQTTKDGAP